MPPGAAYESLIAAVDALQRQWEASARVDFAQEWRNDILTHITEDVWNVEDNGPSLETLRGFHGHLEMKHEFGIYPSFLHEHVMSVLKELCKRPGEPSGDPAHGSQLACAIERLRAKVDSLEGTRVVYALNKQVQILLRGTDRSATARVLKAVHACEIVVDQACAKPRIRAELWPLYFPNEHEFKVELCRIPDAVAPSPPHAVGIRQYPVTVLRSHENHLQPRNYQTDLHEINELASNVAEKYCSLPGPVNAKEAVARIHSLEALALRGPAESTARILWFLANLSQALLKSLPPAVHIPICRDELEALYRYSHRDTSTTYKDGPDFTFYHDNAAAWAWSYDFPLFS
ncbi:hypothetical protein JCM11491_001675 [Sporobolomyces phaffii]